MIFHKIQRCYDRSLLLLPRRVCCLCGTFSPKTSFAQLTNQITEQFIHMNMMVESKGTEPTTKFFYVCILELISTE